MAFESDANGNARTWRHRFATISRAPHLVPAVLACVALAQMLTAHLGTISPWKGGGFGMFATLDRPTARWIRVTAVHNDGSVLPVVVPFGRFSEPRVFTRAFAVRLTTAPTIAQLEALAAAINAADLVIARRTQGPPEALRQSTLFADAITHALFSDSVIHIVGPIPHTGSARSPIREVHVAILRHRFDVKSNSISLESFRNLEVTYPPSDTEAWQR